MLILLSATPDNDRGPQYLEQALAAIVQGNVRRRPISFLIAPYRRTTAILCRFPSHLLALIEGQIGAHYSSIAIERIADDALTPPAGWRTWYADLRLRPDLFPIRRYSQFEDPLNRNTADPLTGLLAAVNGITAEVLSPSIDISVRPAAPVRVRHARTALRHLASPFLRSHPAIAKLYALAATGPPRPVRTFARFLGFVLHLREPSVPTPQLATSPARTHDREEDLVAASDKLGRHLFDARIRLAVSAPVKERDRASAALLRLAAGFAQFTTPRTAAFAATRIRRTSALHPPSGHGSLLSCEELATLWHPATSTVRAPAMLVAGSREFEPPPDLPLRANTPGIAVLGRTKFRSRREVFGIRLDDRRRHVAVIGKTGMGKTTLLEQLLASDIREGRGCALIDPHGDLAEAVVASVPARRTNDIVLFDAGDREYPLAFNLLACRSAHERPLVASGIVSAFKKLYGDSWGPRLEHILRNALLALTEIPGASFLSLHRLLSDGGYRKAVTSALFDPVVRSFWLSEFAHWKPQYQAEAVAPIQNKVGQFLSQPILRAIIGQPRSRLDLRRVMDGGQVLLANLSKGRIGEDASALLGALLVTGIQLAAMGRADVPESDRRDFFFYVDEFQNFATESFATILSEARKYRLNLTIANQYLAQMDEATADAVFGNVGSLLVFQVGARDAEIFAEQLAGDITPRDLLALPRFTAYLRLLIDGMPSRPFSMETLAPRHVTQRHARAAVIRRTSRHRYARPATVVEGEIRRVFHAG